MKRAWCSALLMLTIVMQVSAQQTTNADPDQAAKGTAQLPEGWQVRFDKPDAALDQVTVEPVGEEYHVVTGPAATFYRTDGPLTGTYRISSTFVQNKASAHPEAYGLVFGGSNLNGDDQKYYYFMVRQDGKYLVKERKGPETATLIDWSDHPSIKKAEGSSSATNALAVEVTEKTVDFLVNGTQVGSLERDQLDTTDGSAGIRVNHNLDLNVVQFDVEAGQP